jgi:hypothetical protein
VLDEGLTCIWAGRSRKDWDIYRANVEDTYRGVIATAPGLADRLARAERVTPFKGTSKLPNFYRRSFGAGWALVGDAAYHRDRLPGWGSATHSSACNYGRRARPGDWQRAGNS